MVPALNRGYQTSIKNNNDHIMQMNDSHNTLRIPSEYPVHWDAVVHNDSCKTSTAV